MDPIHILEVSLLSKFINEPSTLLTNPIILTCIIIYAFLKQIPWHIYYYIETEIKEWFLDEKNVSSIMIPYHLKTYTSYGSSKAVDKIVYSDRFRAINYHIKRYHLHKLVSLTEIINFENSRYLEGECDFILLPKDKQKIQIDENEHIFFEIVLEKYRESNDEKDDKTNERPNLTKKYIYKLTKKGKKSIETLNLFLERLEKEYQTEILNKTVQTVFEYKKSVKDDDDQQVTMFTETPFKTNKSFDNIFFEGKNEFIEFISPFTEKNDEIIKQYEKSGNPFKAVIILHGHPGCGKSSLIKATAKYTGRHIILVPWTKIKTCNDFVSLFRPIKINNKTYNQDELIIVFEDFDANENKTIKIREGLKKSKENNKDTDSVDSNTTDDLWKHKIENFMNCQVLPSKIDDELTLEYILNVLDGPVELYNTIVFFTTNDINVIDPALKRTGRIDRILNMERANRKIIKEMIAHRFSVSIKSLDKYIKHINKIREYTIPYADISQICNNSSRIEECLEKILLIKYK
uniref:AAA+ ATPase domain-containing protein n=1 Tax=viral metagenome TaxID=1070528 RepID=A0A6C0HZR0_9ZZZZ